MRVTVCELDATGPLERDWAALSEHTRAEASDLVVLPEMGLSRWLPATRQVDPLAWRSAMADHDAWLERLPELGAPAVAGTRPVEAGGRRFNEAFVWQTGAGYRAAHHKTYLPDERGFWEATWYERGPTQFQPVEAAGATLGFLVCTEVWFTDQARHYAALGVDVVVCPRATPAQSRDTWLAGGRVAGVCAGAFCVSSNHAGAVADVRFAGAGWVTHPDGDVLALTCAERPFVTVDVDLDAAARAKHTYPRYVDASPR